MLTETLGRYTFTLVFTVSPPLVLGMVMVLTLLAVVEGALKTLSAREGGWNTDAFILSLFW